MHEILLVVNALFGNGLDKHVFVNSVHLDITKGSVITIVTMISYNDLN